MATKHSSRLLRLNEFDVENTDTCDTSHKQKAWSVETFKKDFQIVIQSIDESGNSMEFDMIAVDASITNAFRRILIAEVPTMAIDRVYMYNNTSVIADEVLAHRLGLVPIKVDPRLFEYRQEGDEEGSPEDTIEFELKIRCSKSQQNEAADMGALCKTQSVYTSDLKFIPRAEQKGMYGDIKPVDSDILLAKLRPGHEIDLKAHCIKGIGRDHAKFSPVATASYRLLPEIQLLKPFYGEEARKLAQCFSEGVIDVVEKKGKEVAVVANSRLDKGSRNVFQYEEFKDTVSLCKVKDHFIFTIDSTGCLPAESLFMESVGVLKEKCRFFLNELKSMKITE